MKASTTISIVASSQASSGSLTPDLSSARFTTVDVAPYPENWPCSVSVADALVAMCRRRMDPHFSIRFPLIHAVSSLRSHAMSTDGS